MTQPKLTMMQKAMHKRTLQGYLLTLLAFVDFMQLLGLLGLLAYAAAGAAQLQPGSTVFGNIVLLSLIFLGLMVMALLARSWLKSKDSRVMTPVTFGVHLVAFPLGCLVAVAGLLVTLLMKEPNLRPDQSARNPATTPQ